MILSFRLGVSCARILRDAIQEKTGTRLGVTSHPEDVKKLHIRYGNSMSVYCKDTQHNDPSFINICSHKRLFSELLEDNFFVPIFKRTEPTQDDYPLIIRQTMTGFSAQGIIVCPDEKTFVENWQPRYYWTKFIHTSKEYRAQILGGKIGRLFEKRFRGDTEASLPIRNSYSDYHYALVNHNDGFTKLHELVSKVHEVIQGSFYGLDVAWCPDRKEYFIFEANSGYGINPNSANCLADYLISNGILD